MGRYWIGRKDLLVCFLVTESQTQTPVGEAVIKMTDYSDDDDGREFTITTDQSGIATWLFRDCTTTGYKDGFTDTFHCRMPPCEFRAVAAGFCDSKPLLLRVAAQGKIQRGKSRAEVKIPIALRKL